MALAGACEPRSPRCEAEPPEPASKSHGLVTWTQPHQMVPASWQVTPGSSLPGPGKPLHTVRCHKAPVGGAALPRAGDRDVSKANRGQDEQRASPDPGDRQEPGPTQP